MVERRKPIKISEAITRVMTFAKQGSIQHVPIEESLGRFLGEDLIADQNVPPFDSSPYDGFAVRALDTKGASCAHPVQLEVIGTIAAGKDLSGRVGTMQAFSFMISDQIPAGCNA